MYIIYDLLLLFLTIILSPIILIAFVLNLKFRAGFWQKIGFYPKLKDKKSVIWIHAVSVGEVLAVENFVKKLAKTFEDYQIVLTTVTKTGNEVANKKLTNVVSEILYFPYDFSFSVKSAIKAINPKLVIVAETEIWPNFSYQIRKNNIPLMIINGRISPNSYKGYKKFSLFFREIFKNYTSILMQSEDDKNRMVDIGANADITEVMGNLKFDIENNLSDEQILELKNSLAINNSRVIIAGSTHLGEDEIILDTFKKLKIKHSNIKLLIAPRHPERHEQVKKLLEESGFSYGLRSKKDDFAKNEIIMLDTMGELSKLYSICQIAFIGGSFSKTGGHNPLEASIFGKPIISGSSIFNFKDIYKLLIDNNCAIISEKNSLEKDFDKLLSDKEFYANMSTSTQKAFAKSKGAIDYCINKIEKIL
ncbi:MAG: 3-deoxy-D-manno-octulosonic acid transferase [Candidatus Gastranaerophilales bacterium]|nr:3-deoxy-D-manno-octulosonic acid transferase [Candidatus Gastranaerophilales bacterium]